MAWTDFILPTIMVGAGYFEYKERDKKRKQLQQAYDARQQAELARYEYLKSASGGGGRGNTRAAMAQLQQNYAKANALLQPYVDQAAKVLPITSDLYAKGLQGSQPLVEGVMNPNFLNSIMSPPPVQQQKLPGFLAGGS